MTNDHVKPPQQQTPPKNFRIKSLAEMADLHKALQKTLTPHDLTTTV